MAHATIDGCKCSSEIDILILHLKVEDGWKCSLYQTLNLQCKISDISKISFHFKTLLSYWQGFPDKFSHLQDCTFK